MVSKSYPNHPPDGPHNSPAHSPPNGRAESSQAARSGTIYENPRQDPCSKQGSALEGAQSLFWSVQGSQGAPGGPLGGRVGSGCIENQGFLTK